jgi:anti-sigma factor RsiW
MNADPACNGLGLRLAEASDAPDRLCADTRRHVETCLRCQAELAAYRKLRRSLGAMRPSHLRVDPRWVDELAVQFRPSAPVYRLPRPSSVRRRRLGGVVAAATAVGAGLVVAGARLARPSSLA